MVFVFFQIVFCLISADTLSTKAMHFLLMISQHHEIIGQLAQEDIPSLGHAYCCLL